MSRSCWRGQIAAVPRVLSMLHVGSMTAGQGAALLVLPQETYDHMCDQFGLPR